jgi:deoxyribodipyrimidine photolyase
VFADGSEDIAFRYEETIRPIANALLNMENIEEDDTTAIQAIKSILKYKLEIIEELERELEQKDLELAEVKVKHHERIDKIHEEYERKATFLMNQIELKDKRIDALLNAVYTKDAQHKELLDVILSCPARKEGECK